MPAARSRRRRGSLAAALAVLVAPDPQPGLVVSNPLCLRYLPVRPGVLLNGEDQNVGAQSASARYEGASAPGLTRSPDPAQFGEGAWRAFKANSRELELILKKRP